MISKQETGRNGEDIAAQFLVQNHYIIIARNYRIRQGEIDIIARREGYLVFIEVKTRSSRRFAQACEFVTPQKQKRIITAALSWLSQNPSALQPRFDVVEVYWPEGAAAPSAIQHMQNAFEAQ